MVGSDPEAILPVTNFFITDRALIWYNIVAIFQGTYEWMYLNTAKRHRDVRMGYKLVYNQYLSLRNVYHMAAVSKKKLSQCTYTGEKRNWTFKKYYTLHKEQHEILESLMEHGYTGINQR